MIQSVFQQVEKIVKRGKHTNYRLNKPTCWPMAVSYCFWARESEASVSWEFCAQVLTLKVISHFPSMFIEAAFVRVVKSPGLFIKGLKNQL